MITKPIKTDKPWGYELLFAHTDKYAGKILSIKALHRLSLQFHKVKDESIYVYSGKVTVLIKSNLHYLKEGDCFRIEPKVQHRFIAETDTILIEVSTPELDDVVRMSDDYGRD